MIGTLYLKCFVVIHCAIVKYNRLSLKIGFSHKLGLMFGPCNVYKG